MKERTALLIIDVQVGMFSPRQIYQDDILLTKLQDLIKRARNQGVPIIFVQHVEKAGEPLELGSTGCEIHPLVFPLPRETVIQKQTPDAFFQTELQSELERRGIIQLVVAGLQTEYCIDTTCRRAYSLGYEVVLVKDAHSTRDNGDLTASQIIAHHNEVLGDWFVKLVSSENITF